MGEDLTVVRAGDLVRACPERFLQILYPPCSNVSQWGCAREITATFLFYPQIKFTAVCFDSLE